MPLPLRCRESLSPSAVKFFHFRTALRCAAILACVASGPAALAQSAPSDPASLGSITVTATRHAERIFDVPASVDTIDASAIRNGQPQVNLSESLVLVPGIFAANRQNYAQDLQISSRGFGGRAAFGVRGVRLYQDGIPVTMPDGQGQTGSFSLLSAQRIEVLRGPFSALYGNASGGVISVFTEDPPAEPMATITGGGGSDGMWTLGTKFAGTARGVGYVVAANEFRTDGFREHSQARRDLTNAKLGFELAPSTRVTLIGNSQYQPETQDPLGLTRAQWSANPRGVDPAALQYDTRKTINQVQGGAAVDHRFSDALQLHVDAYGGRRLIRQYLAFPGSLPASAGGVPDIDRDYGGLGARLVWRGTAFSRPLTLTAGGDADRQHELRTGYVNVSGALGELRRNEDDTVTSRDFYAQAEWEFAPRWTGTAGLRSSSLDYKSVDHYVTATNPDDSGSQSYDDTSPVLGLVLHASDSVNVCASYGEGFETPTFVELAYRNGATGLNFALRPATSRAAESGVKVLLPGGARLNLAIFHVDTRNEIVVDQSSGGRTTYRNAGATRRNGAELLWDAALAHGLHAHAALTWLRAEFVDAFTSGSAATPVAPGARLPGVPSREAYAELAWAPGGSDGFSSALEAQYVDKLYVNDANADAAPAYAVMNARVGYALTEGRATWSAYARLNNLFDRNYAGSVIVGDGNGRFFEPAPGRNWFFGASLRLRL